MLVTCLQRPVGIMPTLDDVCIQMHATTEGIDQKFSQKLIQACNTHAHFIGGQQQFTVKHYAGDVTYNVDGFCEANKDTLYRDLILLMKTTTRYILKTCLLRILLVVNTSGTCFPRTLIPMIKNARRLLDLKFA